MSKNIKIIFTLSFLLNIILVGVVLGGVYKKRSFHVNHLAEVSPQTREIFKKHISKNRSEMQKHFEQLKGHKQDIKNIIIAEKFDEQAYSDKMDQILAIKNTMVTQKAKTLGQTLSKLSQEERKEMSTHVLRKFSGKRHGKHKGRNHMK